MKHLFFLCFSLALSASTVEAQFAYWIVKTDLGVGLSEYWEADFASNSKATALVWSYRLQGSRIWPITKRLGVGPSIGLVSRAYSLKSSTDLDRFMPQIGSQIQPGEERTYIHRVFHLASYALASANIEYALARDKLGRKRLLVFANFQTQRILHREASANFRTRGSSKGLLNFIPAFESTASKPEVDDYFWHQISPWLFNWEAGLSLAAPLCKEEKAALRFTLSYERGLTDPSIGLLRPAHSIRMSITGIAFQ